MTRSRSRARTESGAIAVLFAVCALVLFLIAALVVDLGLARSTRRDSQAAADASALAAANVLWPGGTCTTPVGSSPPCLADAVAAAKSYAVVNFGVTAADWASCPAPPAGFQFSDAGAKCVSFDSLTAPSRVWVVMPTRNLSTTFGQLAGVSRIPVGARAQAGTTKGQPPAGPLRPWGLCSGAMSTSGNVIFVPLKGGTLNPAKGGPSDPCGTGGPPGGWWVAQCTGQGNGTGATSQAVSNGCAESHSAVPNQPAGATPAQLTTFLENACPAKTASATCLTSDPGKNFNLAQSAFQSLVGQTFTMPVICSVPSCTQIAVSGSGNNASYPIQRIATVILCGFSLSGPSTNWPTTGRCATNNPAHYVASDVISGSGLFLVVTGLAGGSTPGFSLAAASIALTQ